MLKKDNKGFTIIEVLIVLAIAGLILLIVFLAVPALQRNSRNTQTRNNVASVLGMISEYSSNNQGRLPAGAFANTTSGDVCMAAAAITTCTATDANKYGTISTGVSVALEAVGGLAAATDQLSEINFATNAKCDSMTVVSAQNRTIAAMFRVESAGVTTGTLQCQQS